jgi:CHAT domain-containing protein
MVIFNNGRMLEGREYAMYKNCILYQIENTRSYSVYWKPLASILKDVHTVYFSPDGVFNKVNLVTLFDTESQKFLIDRIDVRLVGNTREILDQSVQLKKTSYAALFGYPDFGSAEEKHGSVPLAQHLRTFSSIGRANEIPDLPGTQNKWQVKLFTRGEATEENVKAEHSPTVLHIATHGFFIESPDRDTKLVYSQQVTDFERTPLLRSGLLLAGSENYSARQENNATGSEDGVLTALEAMNLSLDNTDLVVLSACETASGQIKNGEGVFGLQRAFLVSGAQSVLMSLWKVDDQATQELMTTFYTRWLTMHHKHNALRETQLKIREKFPQPYYWGSFIMIGH